MTYIVAGNLPPDATEKMRGGTILAAGEPRVFEGPWPFGRTSLAWAPEPGMAERIGARLAECPGAGAYGVEPAGEPGSGEAFAVAAHRIRDPARFRDYAARVADVVGAFGGRFLARGGTVTPIAGAFAPERAVIIEFPSAQAAVAFYTSDAYAPLLSLRLETTDPRFILLRRARPVAARLA